MAYMIFLSLHSYLRWFVLLLGVVAILKAIGGWLGKKPWQPSDQKIGAFFIGSLDLQLLVGLLLFFFLSPIIQATFQDPGAAMANRVTRFFTAEHTALMVIGTALAHVGRARSRRIDDPTRKHKTVAIFFGLALLLILAGIPWPFLSHGRPLFR